MTGYRIEKQSYSRGAWRVLDADTGEQIWAAEVVDHFVLGPTRVNMPVCFQRKRDAAEWVAAQEAKP